MTLNKSQMPESCLASVIASTDLNRVHHADFLDNSLPDKCAKLIIADPPYFEVKGEFDFIWKSFDDYLKDVEKWAIECKRILADNGTVLWYGDSKKIAYSQIIFDKYFNLLSNVTCHIYDRQTNKITVEDARSFINTTERILMYGNELKNDSPFAKIMYEYMLKLNLSQSDISKLELSRNGNVTGWVHNKLSGEQLPTKEQWIKICNLFKIENEYEKLKNKYYNTQRAFYPTEQYKMDVLRVSQEGHITGKYEHETVKPEKLTRILIKTCSRENDLVVIPFAGSGTECAMSVKENRNFVAYEITEKHVNMSNKRVKKILDNPPLFAGL